MDSAAHQNEKEEEAAEKQSKANGIEAQKENNFY